MTRDERQQEFANKWLESDRKGILLLSPRMGKIFTTINILEKLPPHCTILITYPDNKIRKSWEEDFIKRNYTNPNVTFVTHISLHKYQDKIFDLIIIDECHLLSDNQIIVCQELFKENEQILGLTGTLAEDTEKKLYNRLNLPVLAEYTIEEAVEEKIVTDYEISIVEVPLDVYNRKLVRGKYVSEKQQFDSLTWVINKLEKEKKSSMFIRLKRMRIIQNSLSKLNKTKELLSSHPEERILVFAGTINIADNLGIPSYHSKSSEKKLFQEFAEGKGNHLAVIKIGNSGVNYVPLNRVIINYFSSSSEDLTQRILRCMSLEYNNPEKSAKILIISSTEPTEKSWLESALKMFNPQKIKYL